ncbi:FAR1 DNA-binding domain [Sesbania bispinosa]|nr:FAR1 DNA-binding domain [Sesbania bispinosa]
MIFNSMTGINSNVEESQQMDAENDLLQGLDDMTITDEEVEESSDEEDNDPCGETDGEDSGDGTEHANMEEAINIDSLQDIQNLDMKNISPEDVKREGERDKKRQNNKPKREAKRKIMCGCKARLRVHVDINSGRWYVTIFDHLHNHEMLGERLCAMLPAHRKMSPADIMEMNSLRNVGISTPDIYAAFASQSGGYHKIGFRKKDLYNQIGRQRRLRASDAITAIEYLEGLRAHDPYLYLSCNIDVAKFQIRWDQMVSKFGLEDHCWVKELYEKRKMWASAHIRDATEIPKSLILDRWTKIAKESIRGSFSDASYFWDSQLMARYVSLLELCRQLCNLAHHDDEDFNHIREIITSEIQILKDKHGAQFAQENTESQILDGNLRNPANVRSKGCGTRSGSGTTRGKRLNKCSVCGVACHNKKSCPQQRPVNDVDPSMCGNSMREVGEGSGLNNINLSVDPCCSRLNDNPPLQ